MVHNLSQTGNTVSSSPGINMMSFGTPVGLGVEGITPHMNIPTPNMAGLSMGMTMSDFSLPTSGGPPKRSEDEERRAKMRKVLKSIGKPKGRVSEEGIARVSRSLGFANDIDAEKLTAEERERKVGNRAIGIGGHKIVVEVDLKNHVPRSVQVSFDTENEGLAAQADAAGKVLLDDLPIAPGVAFNAKLDRFALNLERLARIDRLCANQVNCFEALSGVYACLRRLYEQETAVSKELDVMRKRSGRPVVHTNGRLGTSIEYWQERAHVPQSSPSDGDMDVDDKSGSDNAEQGGKDAIFTLRIGIEPSPAALYPSIRLSDTWLPDPLELPVTNSAEVLPWQDPPPTLISSGVEADAMAIDSSQKLPNLRFTAKLDPPLVLPYQVASAVLQSVGLPAPQVFITQAWHAQVLDPTSTTPFDPNKDSLSTTIEQSVLSIWKERETEVTHHYVVEVMKPDMAYKLEELPFSHPRQLIEALPTLRQWACFGSLIQGIFGGSITGDNGRRFADDSKLADGITYSHHATLSLDDILTPPTTPSPFDDKLPVSISLSTSPVPALSLNFPSSSEGSTLGNVSVQILPNAELVVTSHESIPGAVTAASMEDSAEDKSGRQMARALELCGDVGVWIEWLKSRSG